MIPLWGQVAIALLAGAIPGVVLIPALASPFGPPLGPLSAPLARVLLTVGQFIRGAGVLVKRASGEYEIGTWIPAEDGGPAVQLSDRRLPVDPDRITWGLFGKKRFGITWEPGTELHERAALTDPADDGDFAVDMGAVHRYLRGANEMQPIDRTEEHAAAEYGGGDDKMSDRVMAVLVIVMLLLGTATGYVMVGM